MHIFDIQSPNPELLRLVVQKGRIAVNSCRLSRFWTPCSPSPNLCIFEDSYFWHDGYSYRQDNRKKGRKEGYIGRQCGAATERNCYPKDTQKVSLPYSLPYYHHLLVSQYITFHCVLVKVISADLYV